MSQCFPCCRKKNKTKKKDEEQRSDERHPFIPERTDQKEYENPKTLQPESDSRIADISDTKSDDKVKATAMVENEKDNSNIYTTNNEQTILKPYEENEPRLNKNEKPEPENIVKGNQQINNHAKEQLNTKENSKNMSLENTSESLNREQSQLTESGTHDEDDRKETSTEQPIKNLEFETQIREKQNVSLQEQLKTHKDYIEECETDIQDKTDDDQGRQDEADVNKLPEKTLIVPITTLGNDSIKIGEKYWNLYEKMKDLSNGKKEDSLFLTECVKECYLYCRKAASDQMKALLLLLFRPTKLKGSLMKRIKNADPIDPKQIPAALMQSIIVFRRTHTEIVIDDLYDDFFETVKKKQAGKSKPIETFVRSCVDVCWEMGIQEPPMHLHFKLKHNEEIDLDKFTLSSRGRNKVDYLVWPALFQNKDGFLIKKGVVKPLQ